MKLLYAEVLYIYEKRIAAYEEAGRVRPESMGLAARIQHTIAKERARYALCTEPEINVCTGLQYEAGPRLGECCRQVEAEVVGDSRNKIHQSWGPPILEPCTLSIK